MSVYVDNPLVKWKGMVWCHLLADNLEELHKFAKDIGLKKEWFQSPPNVKYPHYDIPEFRRKIAVEKGAIIISRREVIAKAKILKEQFDTLNQ